MKNLDNMIKLTPDIIRQRLEEHHDDVGYFKNFLGQNYTEGVRDLADMCHCNWLIDIISCYQHKMFVNQHKRQTWKLRVRRNVPMATLKMFPGIGCEQENFRVVAVHIDHVDFPLPRFTLCVSEGVLMLPGEFD